MSSVATRLSDPRFAALLVLLLTVWRVATLPFDETDLWVDEAQYWLWGQHPAWGYFSKPPLIAFWLRGVTDLAGSDSAFWIRVSGAFLHALTAFLVALSATRLFTPRVGAAAAVIYASLPMVTVGSWQFSTDTLLLPCFALAFYAYLRLRETPSTGWALVFGAALGLGFLAKYAVIYFPLSLALAALLLPAARIGWRDAAVGLGVMALLAAPNIWWNISNGGTTVRHIAKDNAQVDAAGLNPGGAIEFLASQFAVFGPVTFATLLLALWMALRRRAPEHSGLLLLFALPVIALMTFQGLRAEANANWAVTGYVAGTILVAALLCRKPRLLAAAVAINLIPALLLPVLYTQAATLRLPDGRLIAERYLGRTALSEAIGGAAGRAGLDTVVAVRRGVLADLFHRFDGTDLRIHAPDTGMSPRNYYEQVFALPRDFSGEVLFASTGPAPCAAATPLETYAPGDGTYRGLTFTFWRTPAACLRP